MAYLNNPNSFLMTISYDDKYGALGKIAVLLGRMHGKSATIDYWVMSCRAFSRRIEHQCLDWLFENFNLQDIAFAYQPTDRNKPAQDFLASIATASLTSDLHVSKKGFLEKCPPLFHQAKATVNA